LIPSHCQQRRRTTDTHETDRARRSPAHYQERKKRHSFAWGIQRRSYSGSSALFRVFVHMRWRLRSAHFSVCNVQNARYRRLWRSACASLSVRNRIQCSREHAGSNNNNNNNNNNCCCCCYLDSDERQPIWTGERRQNLEYAVLRHHQVHARLPRCAWRSRPGISMVHLYTTLRLPIPYLALGSS
jgi:hypothetical protein